METNPEDNPECPNCNGPMILRNPRAGRNAGNRFWGCERYPKCRGTVNVSDVLPQTGNRLGWLEAVEREHGASVRFLQTSGIPWRFVKTLQAGLSEPAMLNAVSQWRIDGPPVVDGLALPLNWDPVLAVAENLLTRGILSSGSARAEQILGLLFPGSGIAEGDPDVDPVRLRDALRSIAVTPANRYHPSRRSVDSDEEWTFCKQLLSHFRHSTPGWQVIPQVALASLARAGDEDREAQRRCDFLLTHPMLPDRTFVIEVDGDQHLSDRARETDRLRDKTLSRAGIATVRVPARSVRQSGGDLPEGIRAALATTQNDVEPSGRSEVCVLALIASQVVHRVTLIVIEAIRSGWIDPRQPVSIGVSVPEALDNPETGGRLAVCAVQDAVELVRRLFGLYGLPDPQISFTSRYIPRSEIGKEIGRLGNENASASGRANLIIAPSDSVSPELELVRLPVCLYSDQYTPFRLEMRTRTGGSGPPTLSAQVPDTQEAREHAEWFLYHVFRKPQFREGQWQAVRRAVSGMDSIVLLPTGSGKSIAFQLAGLLRPGRTIVIAPLIALIEDQVENLRRNGIDRTVPLTSAQDGAHRTGALAAFEAGHYLFCYVAPERFQIPEFREKVQSLARNSGIGLIAVDEAHCVSEWGHDFRPAYLNLGSVAREQCTNGTGTPPILALTGTASAVVLKDLQRDLAINAPGSVITPVTFDRSNLHFHVNVSSSARNREALLRAIHGMQGPFGDDVFTCRGDATTAGLVFCPHAGSKHGTTEIADFLRSRLGIEVDEYNGKQSAVLRTETTRKFRDNLASLLVCTKAFGMGIDKPNIRYTIHINLPASIESFYQEAGRAGRGEGLESHCHIIVSNDDPERTRNLLSPGAAIDDVARIVAETQQRDSDDIVRNLYFHTRSFKGKEQDVASIMAVVNLLGDINDGGIAYVTWNDEEDKKRLEHAVCRLVILGVVASYAVIHRGKYLEVHATGARAEELCDAFVAYVSSYQRRLGELQRERLESAVMTLTYNQFLNHLASELVAFIYDHIEQARRRALSEMLEATRTGRGEDLRRRILEYLQSTSFSDRVSTLTQSAVGGTDSILPILRDVTSSEDAEELRGEVARALGSYPDNPGLLLLRALAETLARDSNPEMIAQSVEGFFRFSREDRYQLTPIQLAQACAAVVRCADIAPGKAKQLCLDLLRNEVGNRPFLRELLGTGQPHLASLAGELLIDLVVEHAKRVRTGR